ncbi:hypothetical protein Aph02nite_87430 [Actinoplanes philippinensis]|uniref:Uncharacterized protein n=1 Tax=Actinoplanes philippinensis TaxID=35752 RepID=A0A1I2MJS1_9ACTN|nr:hypothetical protein [Actinoplanes philippinensis]GIE82793.1 hypothetical protein Aph02nite_87430 [Actinoplanes philippinensis]SFF90969.1 hypothetical protein SAMN05421541_1302 [Actinoplanes philippinensis]
MLKPEAQQVLTGLVTPIEADGPGFTHPPRWWAVVAVLLWTIAPVCIVYGGWVGLVEAFLVGGFGAYLMRRHRRWVGTARRA